MEVQREGFLVKGAPAKEIDLKFTRHGPVLWVDDKNDGQRALALRWVGTEPGTAGYLASLAIDRAENWDQFESAVARCQLPSRNIGDTDRAGTHGERPPSVA